MFEGHFKRLNSNKTSSSEYYSDTVYSTVCRVREQHSADTRGIHCSCTEYIIYDPAYVDLDKQSINYASVFGLREDLRLSRLDLSWAISIFYSGQCASESVCRHHSASTAELATPKGKNQLIATRSSL